MISHWWQRLNKSDYWKDIAWVLSGNSIAQLIGVLSLPLLTRLYTPADFALQTLFMQIMGGVAVILSLRYEFFIQLPEKDINARDLLLLIIILCIVGAGVSLPFILFFKNDIALFFGDIQLAKWLFLVPITAGLFSVALALQHYLQRQRQYRKSSISELASKGTYVSMAFLGYWFFPGSTGLILAQPMASIGKIIALSEPWKKRNNTNKKNINNVVQFYFRRLRLSALKYSRLSLSLVFSHLMLSATLLIPSTFIARNYGNDSLGQYALVAASIYLPSGVIGTAIGQVYYQRAAERWSNGYSFSDLWYTTSKKLILLALPIYGILFFLSPTLYPLLFGEAWVEAGKFASLISVSAFFSFISSPLDRACLVVGVWWYVPLWHTTRTVTTGMVVWLAFSNSLNVNDFVLSLVIQMSVLYLIDYWAEWKFSHWKKENVS